MAPARAGSRGRGFLAQAFPPILAVLLAIPCFRLPWLWDDYIFLSRAQEFRLHDLLPRGDVLFWRPFSREIWFAILWRVAPHTPLVAHLLHAILVSVAVLLVGSIGSRLFGRRAGFLAATLYASLGALPMLIGWASASQDLFAVLFFLAALHFRLTGRFALSLLATALAILSKETAAFLIPLLVAAPWIVGGIPRRPLWDLGAYGALVAAWAAAHTGIHTLLARRLTAGGSEIYVGLGGLDRLPLLGRGLFGIMNLPVPGGGIGWTGPSWLLTASAAALIAVGVGWRLRHSMNGPNGDEPSPRNSRGTLLAIGIALLPTVGTTALLKVWAPYYASLPGIGTAFLLGAALARIPTRAATAGAIVFMTLGLVLRAQPLDQSTPTEHNYGLPAAALTHVERGFRALRPTVPKGAHLFVSVASTGALQIYTHIHDLQAPRVWYGDPSIRVLRPNLRVPGNRPELLFRITPNLDVIEIDPSDGSCRTSGELPTLTEIARPLRTYARALAATGEVNRGVAIFRMLEDIGQGNVRIVDRRYAVMLLLASGRYEEAVRLAEGVPGVPRQAALDIIAKLYLDAVPDTTMEEVAFPAFGIDPRDLEANRYIMRRVYREGHLRAALRLARRVQAIVPGDPESRDLIQEILSRPAQDFVVAPVMPDSL